ncbi:MAG: EAL domain-containing protein [Gammaproteobacteria bacterium]|nr:EAL domain-containing protein [Gammaproteobacteria bacterium]
MAADASTIQSAVLLVVCESEEIAKRIESHLRNAGHPVRAAWVTDLEDVEDVLRRSPPDLVLCAEGVPEASPQDVIALCNRIAPDLPIVLMGLRLSPQETIGAIAAGAKDLVSHADLKHLHHLELVCIRELLHHQHLRELRNTRVRLADFEARHRNLMAESTDAVVHIQEGILTHVNAAFATLLGHESSEALEGSPMMDLVRPEAQTQAKQTLKLFLQGKLKPDTPIELGLQTKDGRALNAKARMTLGTLNDERFIELLIRAEAAPPAPVAVPAAAPPPPAAPAPPDRIALFDALAGWDSARTPGVLGLLAVAVDGYDTIEDRLGYRDAEQLMTQLLLLLKQRLTPREQALRFSTSELALVANRPRVADIEALSETLRKDVAAQIFSTAGHEAHVSVSIAAYPLSGKEAPKTMVADAVREARKLSGQGGNKVVVVGPAAQVTVAEREELMWIQRIQKAIQDNRLKLAYQSIASLEGDTRQHFDVLVRMLDETGKEIHAKEFIQVAEKHGLIKTIDRWVVARALKVLAKREGAREVSSLFVRVSEETLKDADNFVAWLRELFKQRPLKKDEMVFQIQEIVLQNHIAKARALTQALRQLGGEIALDHFGIGNNSAQILEHIPAGFLRFHFSFTKSFNDAKLQKKMSELMEIAKQKGIRTIVSHVEDANVMARLWQMGVNYIQGHHIQEPEVVLLSTDLPR